MTVKKAEEKKKCKCLCCCCCRRQSSESLDRDHNRNGTRLAHHSETVPALGEEKATNSLTFQHDPSKDVTSPREKNARKKCQTTCVKCCKKFLTFLFSNIGLCSVVVAYSILGGFIFQELEAPNEIRKRHFVASMRSKMAFDIWNLTQTELILQEQNFTRLTERILVIFQNELLDAKKTGWDGNDGSVDPQWSFAGSLLYSVTVITTIGKPTLTFCLVQSWLILPSNCNTLPFWNFVSTESSRRQSSLLLPLVSNLVFKSKQRTEIYDEYIHLYVPTV